MTRRRHLFLATALSAAWAAGFVLAGCAPDEELDSDECRANLLPGDLVITEIYADAAGTDEGREWFEIYNATDATIDLSGLELVHSRNDDSAPRSHTVVAGSIARGAYYVFGGVLPEFAPDYVDYGYSDTLGALRNSNGKLSVRCNVINVDSVTYTQAMAGASLSLDGADTPSATANDNEDNFCTSTIQGNFPGLGSPGEANQRCDGATSDGQCDDGGTRRNPVAPAPGAVVITEFMANPSAVADGNGEWIELLAVVAFDLNGLEIGGDPGDGPDQTLNADECLHVEAGDRVVLANNLTVEQNGGVTADFELSVGLTNGSGALFVGHGGSTLDEIRWTSTTAGASTGLDPRFGAPGDNDNPDNLCTATTPYGDGDLGTPGQENDSCGEVAPASDTCDDGGSERSIVTPATGDLVITELMADPDAVGDAAGEWLEITATRDVDLNGLQLGRDSLGDGLASATCLRLSAGEAVIFANNANAAQNGGLPDAAIVGDLGFSLVNSNGAAQIGIGGEVLDRVTWSSTATGTATQLDPDLVDPTANDDDAAFCPATATYGDGDLGTPGTPNAQCP